MYEKFACLLKERDVSAYQVAKATGIGQSTFSDWKNGRSTPKLDKLQKIADFFGVSVDYFSGSEKEKPAAMAGDELSEKEHRDIARKVEALMADLAGDEDVMFDGDPMTPEAMDSLRQALTLGYELARKINKEKYTPRKYKK